MGEFELNDQKSFFKNLASVVLNHWSLKIIIFHLKSSYCWVFRRSCTSCFYLDCPLILYLEERFCCSLESVMRTFGEVPVGMGPCLLYSFSLPMGKASTPLENFLSSISSFSPECSCSHVQLWCLPSAFHPSARSPLSWVFIHPVLTLDPSLHTGLLPRSKLWPGQ